MIVRMTDDKHINLDNMAWCEPINPNGTTIVLRIYWRCQVKYDARSGLGYTDFKAEDALIILEALRGATNAT